MAESRNAFTGTPNESGNITLKRIYEGWNFNSGNYFFTTDTK